MTYLELLVKSEHKLRKYFYKFKPEHLARIYSLGRKFFVAQLVHENAFEKFHVPEELNLKLWDITFANPLFNAAGMFKKGEGYRLAVNQGAGAYLAGTTTSLPRSGNRKNSVIHPFIPYPYSSSASNWMGLPNESHEIIARRLYQIDKSPKCPIGASIALDAELDEKSALEGLLSGFNLYDRARVDFIELNESCPNVSHHDSDISNPLDDALIRRLEIVSKQFLKKRNRNLPVIVKFSNDIEPDSIPALIDVLIDNGFDGINLGNTSTQYSKFEPTIDRRDKHFYEYFTSTFGGGLSGSILKENSYRIASIAAAYIKEKNLKKEFHVIRTGGVSDIHDIKDSKQAGIPLNQWFSGYFESFAKYGHDLYKEIFS